MTYTVTAQDGSKLDYMVTVQVAPATSKAITAFSFANAPSTAAFTGTSIAVTVPSGTNVSALVAIFATTGASVRIGNVVQSSGTKANDFTGALTYTVVAADGSPVQHDGRSDVPGLSFLGFPWLRSRKSEVILGAQEDAAAVVEHVKARLAATGD